MRVAPYVRREQQNHSEILSNVVDRLLAGGEDRWSVSEQILRCWLWPEDPGLAVRKLDASSDQRYKMRRIDSPPTLLGSDKQLEGYCEPSFS